MHKFKRMGAVLVAAMCLMSMAGCSKKKEETKKNKDKSEQKKESVTEKASEVVDDVKTSTDESSQDNTFVELADTNEKIVFSVVPDYDLKQDSWMGIVPAGKDYKKEVDADEVDILYYYVLNAEKKASETYIFEFMKEDVKGLDDGKYSMVLCDTDEDTGKVLLQFPIEKKGTEIIPDFSSLKFNT